MILEQKKLSWLCSSSKRILLVQTGTSKRYWSTKGAKDPFILFQRINNTHATTRFSFGRELINRNAARSITSRESKLMFNYLLSERE